MRWAAGWRQPKRPASPPVWRFQHGQGRVGGHPTVRDCKLVRTWKQPATCLVPPWERLATMPGLGLKQVGWKTAAGAHGLQTDNWSWWPKTHGDRLAQLVSRCKRKGQRAKQQRLAHVTLLSKGGKPVRGLQAKPITAQPLV